MLVLSRCPGEGLTIRLNPCIDPATPVGELLGDAVIHVLVTQCRGNHVRVGVDAPFEFEVVRDELLADVAPTSIHCD